MNIMSTDKHIEFIAKKLGLHEWQVENTIRLLDDGATIPFISRYRKEMTGSLDEVQLMHIKDEFERLKELDKRRDSIIRSIVEQEKMTPELSVKDRCGTYHVRAGRYLSALQTKEKNKGNNCQGKRT